MGNNRGPTDAAGVILMVQQECAADRVDACDAGPTTGAVIARRIQADGEAGSAPTCPECTALTYPPRREVGAVVVSAAS